MITTLHLGLSYACNLSCKHCFVNRKNDNLSINQYKQIIDVLSEAGLLMLFYTYGEPLLSQKLPEVASYASLHKINQTILTNGWFLDCERLDELSSYGISNYMVSLDSTNASVHDANRGVEGAFDHAVSAIRVLVNNKKNVTIGCTVTEKNIHTLNNMVTFANQEGVKRISFLAHRNNGTLAEIIDQEYVDFFRDALLSNDGIQFFFHDPRLLPILSTAYEENIIDANDYYRWKDMLMCHTPYSISIGPDGSVSRCNLCPRTKYIIGKNTDIPNLLNQVIGDTTNDENPFCCSMFSGKN